MNFSVRVLLISISFFALHANAENQFNYDCVDASGESYDLMDSSGLQYIRVQTNENVALICQKTSDEAQIELVSTHTKRKPSHHHVKSHCHSAGQACWGLYCETECCHSPAGITSLLWYSCE